MAVAIRQRTPVRNEDVLDLSLRNPGLRFERGRDGRLIVSPTGAKSGSRNAELTRLVADYARAASTHVSFDSSTGFVMPDGALFSPDGALLRTGRWEALTSEQQEGYAPLCPDVVFEIRSRSDDASELHEKMLAYVRNGAELAVAIDPYERIVRCYRPDAERRDFGDPKEVSLEPELPGFTLMTAALLS